MALSDCELLRIMKKFQEPVKRRVIKKSSNVPSPMGTGTGSNDPVLEPIGNEEFVPIVKKEYGFDWEKNGDAFQ